MSTVYSEQQLDHYLASMDRVAALWWQKFPERAAYCVVPVGTRDM